MHLLDKAIMYEGIEEKWHQFMNDIKHLMDKRIAKSRSHIQNEIKLPTDMTGKS